MRKLFGFMGRNATNSSRRLRFGAGTGRHAARLGLATLMMVGLHQGYVGLSQSSCDSQTSRDPGPIETIDLFIDPPKDLKPATPVKVTVEVPELDGKTYTFLLHHTNEEKIGATGALCPHDFKTDLSTGLLVNNKLVCPEHGCEFNCYTGDVENGPALNGLPAFYVDRLFLDGKLQLRINMPINPPLAVTPMMLGKNQNDFRKVLIVGCGGGALGNAETLRKIGYGGEITMFCDSPFGPINRRNLTKFTKLEGNEHQVFLRNSQFFQDTDIQILPANRVNKVTILDEYGHLQLTDKSRYYFDALVVASGLYHPKQDQEEGLAPNHVSLFDIGNFKQAQKLLTKSKSVVINGITLSSLELASTLLREKPGVEIHMFQKDKDSRIVRELGPDVYEAMVKKFREQGVKFHTETYFRRFLRDGRSGLIQGVIYGPSKNRTKQVDVDLVYEFPSRTLGHTDFIDTNDYKDHVFKTSQQQIQVSVEQRTPTKFIFAAGGAAVPSDFVNNVDNSEPSFADAFYQGEIAAYNLQSLRIANTRSSFNYFNILGTTLQTLSPKPLSDEIWTEGDPNSMEFISYFLLDNKIMGVNATKKYQREMMLIKEASRSGLIIDVGEIRRDREAFFKKLATDLAADPSHCCHRDIIFRKRYNMAEKDIFWLDRSTTEEVRSEDFINFKPEQQGGK